MPCILVKNLPAIWGTWVPSLGGEDPLEEGMATHSSILARRIPWTRETGGLQSMGLQRGRQGWAMDIFTFPCAHESEEWASWKRVISWLSRATVCTSLKESTCIPVADSFWYLAKLIQLCKVRLTHRTPENARERARPWPPPQAPLF